MGHLIRSRESKGGRNTKIDSFSVFAFRLFLYLRPSLKERARERARNLIIMQYAIFVIRKSALFPGTQITLLDDFVLKIKDLPSFIILDYDISSGYRCSFSVKLFS